MKRHERFNLSYSQWEYLIHEWILDERNRQIARDYLLDGKSAKELSDKYNLSVQGIRKVIDKSENKLFPKAKQLNK